MITFLFSYYFCCKFIKFIDQIIKYVLYGLCLPGLTIPSFQAKLSHITAGPMSARAQFGGLNALGGSGTRASEIKSALKSNYMSRFTKASSTTQKPFLSQDKGFVKPPSNSLYSGFSKASTAPNAGIQSFCKPLVSYFYRMLTIFTLKNVIIML